MYVKETGSDAGTGLNWLRMESLDAINQFLDPMSDYQYLKEVESEGF
jgi:hypothetical protein